MLSPEFLQQLEQLSLAVRRLRRGQGQGTLLSRRRGRSPEFSDFRPYVPGDEPRFIDWNIWGRLEQLATKLFLEEEALEVRLVIDTSASMGNKFPFTAELAAALGYLALAGGSRIRLAAPRPGGDYPPDTSPALKGKSAFPRLLAFLEKLRPGGKMPLSALGVAAAGFRSGGLDIFLSDFLDADAGARAALQAAARRGTELYAVQILSPEELNPPLDGAVRIDGLEDGETLDLHGGRELGDAYRRTLDEYCQDVADQCRECGAGYWCLSSGENLQAAVLLSLRRAGLVR